MPASLRTSLPSAARRAVLRSPERCTEPCSDLRLELEQDALALEPAAVAGEGAVRADHAVARHDDRDRVAAVGEADGADLARVAERERERAVGGRLAIRDAEQQVPDAALEGGPGGAQLELELRALAGEVLGELAGRLGERLRVVLPDGVEVERRHVEAGQGSVLGGQQELPDRAVDDVVGGRAHARLQRCWTA